MPGDCVFTGLCTIPADPAGPSSGLLFVALGLVLFGLAGLWRQRRVEAQMRSRKPAIP